MPTFTFNYQVLTGGVKGPPLQLRWVFIVRCGVWVCVRACVCSGYPMSVERKIAYFLISRCVNRSDDPGFLAWNARCLDVKTGTKPAPQLDKRLLIYVAVTKVDKPWMKASSHVQADFAQGFGALSLTDSDGNRWNEQVAWVRNRCHISCRSNPQCPHHLPHSRTPRWPVVSWCTPVLPLFESLLRIHAHSSHTVFRIRRHRPQA